MLQDSRLAWSILLTLRLVYMDMRGNTLYFMLCYMRHAVEGTPCMHAVSYEKCGLIPRASYRKFYKVGSSESKFSAMVLTAQTSINSSEINLAVVIYAHSVVFCCWCNVIRSGVLPDSLGQLSALERLHLSHNKFKGERFFERRNLSRCALLAAMLRPSATGVD